MSDSAQHGSASDTALVTGGTGFVGSHVVRRLVRDGVSVHLLCRPQTNFWRLEGVLPHIHVHAGAVEDSRAVREVVQAVRPDRVFHLAAATMVAGQAPETADLLSVNVTGAINLLNACDAVRCKAIVMTGDSFEYAASSAPLCEAHAGLPRSIHGLSKLAATCYATAMAASRGLPVVTLRLFSTYGPGDHPRRLVPRVIAQALAGTPIALAQPTLVRDWVYVDDVVQLYLEASSRAAELAGGVFNAGSGAGTGLGELVGTIFDLTGSSADARWGTFPAPEHDAFPWVADTRHTFAAFAWRPVTSLRAGLTSAIDAMRQPNRS